MNLPISPSFYCTLHALIQSNYFKSPLAYNFRMQQDQQLPIPSEKNTNNQNETQKPLPLDQQPKDTLLSHNPSKEYLQKELQAMEFQPHLIEQALSTANTLQSAIQTIIEILEAQQQLQISNDLEVHLILVVRMDLKMGMGKIAAQCAHAILRAFQIGRAQAEKELQFTETFIQWLEKGKKQVVFKVQDEEQLFSVLSRAKGEGALTTYIRDAGRTQIAAGSATVGAIGPVSALQMKGITSNLRLL